MRNFVKRALEKLDKLENLQKTDLMKELLLNINSENQLLEMVLESMTDGVIVLDNEHNIILVNKSSKRLIPFIQGEVLEKVVWEAVVDREIAYFLRKVLMSHEKVTDVQFTLGNGTTLIISTSIMPLVSRGRIQGNLIHIEDITEKKSREARLRRAESLAALTTLTAGVAHEIKNPLGSIGIHIQLIQKHMEMKCESSEVEDLKKYLSVIKEEVERLNKVVVDFLFAVHPINAEFENRNLNEVLHDLLEFMKYELQEADIDLKESLKDIPNIELDEKFIKQALLNIIKNAIAAMPDGGSITMSTFRKDDLVYLKVEDTGTGIPDHVMNKIFEPYFTTKDFGSGLGLTIVYKIIKEHLGDITVTTRENEGTAFLISFPIPQKEKHLLDYRGDENEI